MAKFEALLDECDLVAHNAAYGEALNDVEAFFLIQGRKFLQETFQEKFQEHIKRTETTAAAKECPHCKKKTRSKDEKSKTVVCVHGDITLERCYRYCRHCEQYSFPVEVLLGLATRYTNGLRRLAARCCGLGSYRLAADNLDELCGIQLSHTKIGEIADETSGKIAEQMENNAALRGAIREGFQKAEGETEFSADGTCIRTRNDVGEVEYKEVRVGAFAKRVPSESALPEEWATRDLLKPTVVSAFAAIESAKDFQSRCQRERRRIGVGGVTSTLGDGALWIWSLVFMVFGKTCECLDIYHAMEHISECGKELYGTGQVFKDWLERLRLMLLSEGFAGMERELSVLLSGKLKKDQRKSVESLLEYLRKNRERLHYAERLALGRAIGSGLIEGACKNLIGKRMKQTGACWHVPRATRIATLCAALYSNQWKLCWKKYH